MSRSNRTRARTGVRQRLGGLPPFPVRLERDLTSASPSSSTRIASVAGSLTFAREVGYGGTLLACERPEHVRSGRSRSYPTSPRGIDHKGYGSGANASARLMLSIMSPLQHDGEINGSRSPKLLPRATSP